MVRGEADGSRYELLDELGRGGMGVVHRARDTQLNRLVALKLCTFDDGRGEGRARFHREVETCAKLSHPSIVRIFDYGTFDGRPYYTMELLEARDLEHIQRSRSPLPPERLVPLLAQAADALAFLHASGIVHRDVKPSNIMVDAVGVLKLTDFGLVRVRDRTAITEDGETLGTLRYLAPEALDTSYEAAPAQDVYALGLVAWELLAGRRAFSEGSMMELLRDIVQLDPPPLGEVRPGTPEWLSELIACCLAKDPAQRPGAAEVRDACRAPPSRKAGPRRPSGRVGPPSRGTGGSGPAAPARFAGHRPARRVGVALGVAGLGAGVALVAWLAMRSPAMPERIAHEPASPASAKPAAAIAPHASPVANVYWLETDRAALADFDILAPVALSVEIASKDGSAVVTTVSVPAGTTTFHRWIGGLAKSTRYLLRIRDVSRGSVVAHVPIATRDRRHAPSVRTGLELLVSNRETPEFGLSALSENPDPSAVSALVELGSRPTGVGQTNRAQIARLLGVLREPAGADVLAAFIERGEDPDVSLLSLRALAACRSARAAQAARELFARYNAPVHHERIFRALGVRASEAAFDVLREHVDRGEPGAFSPLGAALARTSPGRARELVTRRATGSPPRVAGVHDLHTACALGGDDMIRLMTPLLDDRSSPLRPDAVLALSALGGPLADAALDAALHREPVALGLLVAAGRRRLPGAERAILMGLAPEQEAPVRAAALAAAGLLAADPAAWREGAPPSPVLERVLALASDPTALLHETAVVTLARWVAAGGGKRLALRLPWQIDDAGRFALARAQAGDAGVMTVAAAKLRREDVSPAGLARRSRLVLALAHARNPEAVERGRELEKSGGAFARWAGFEAARLARAPTGERAYFIDPMEMLHNTGVRVEAGEVVWLRAGGVLGWGDPGSVEPIGFNFRDRVPVALSPCALVAGASLSLQNTWTPYLIERGGELEIWMHGTPHHHTPGRDPALLPSRAQGVVTVWIRRGRPAPATTRYGFAPGDDGPSTPRRDTASSGW